MGDKKRGYTKNIKLEGGGGFREFGGTRKISRALTTKYVIFERGLERESLGYTVVMRDYRRGTVVGYGKDYCNHRYTVGRGIL